MTSTLNPVLLTKKVTGVHPIYILNWIGTLISKISPPSYEQKTSYFLNSLKTSFLPRRRCPSNLTPLQHYVMDKLTKLESHVVLLADKGLGPVIMERYTYVAACLSLLLNENNYEQLDKVNACFQSQKTVGKVQAWMKKFDSVISDSDKKIFG